MELYKEIWEEITGAKKVQDFFGEKCEENLLFFEYKWQDYFCSAREIARYIPSLEKRADNMAFSLLLERVVRDLMEDSDEEIYRLYSDVMNILEKPEWQRQKEERIKRSWYWSFFHEQSSF